MKSKQLLIRTIVTFILIIIGWQAVNMVTNLYTPPLPDYAQTYSDSTLWQNSISSVNNTQWEYRRKITITNPTDENQTGTYGFKLPFYYPWIGDKKVFKLDYGIVKLVKEYPNPDSNGAPLLREQPIIMFGEDASNILVYFDYSINANSINTYYLYYKQSKDVDISTYDGTKVGIASLGGLIVDSKKAGMDSQTGFSLYSSTQFKSHPSNGSAPSDYYYYDNLVVDDKNRWPRYKEYSAGGGGGMRTDTAFESKNKYIRIAGERFNSLDYVYMGFFNGSLTPANGSVPINQFIGIQTLPDSSDIDNPEDGPRGYVNDFKWWYANGTKSAWNTTYEVPKDTSDIFDWDFKRVNFLYEFFIDDEGNLTFKLSEDGFDHKEIYSVNLGHLPWDTTYFQVSAYTYYFKFNSLMVTSSDVYDSQQANGCIIEEGYESQLTYLKTLRTENTLVFILGIITLVVVLIHFLLRHFSDYVVRVYLFAMIFVILFFMFRYHPFRYVFGIEDGYYYLGTSEAGLELMANAGTVNPFFYYFMYFAMPLGILLVALNYLKKNDTKFGGKAKSIITSIALVLAVIFSGLFFTGSVMNLSFYFYCVAIIVILINSFKDGKDSGKSSMDQSKKGYARAIAKLSFLYFVIKIILDGYKNWNISDPFTILNSSNSGTEVALGTLGPILLGYGVPVDVINIVAVVFSDYATYIVLGFNFLRQAFTSDSSIFGKINAGVWAVYLNIAGESIHIPFFAMSVSMMMVVGYLIGNRYGEVIDLMNGELNQAIKTQYKTKINEKPLEQKSKQKLDEKSSIKPTPTPNSAPKPTPTPVTTPTPTPNSAPKPTETPVTTPTPTPTSAPKPTQTPVTTPTSTSISSSPPEPRFALMPTNENKMFIGDAIELKWNIDNADGMDYILKENEQLIMSGKYDGSKPFVFVVKDKPIGKFYYKISVEKPGHSWTNESKVIVQAKNATISASNTSSVPMPEPAAIPPPSADPPTFTLMPSNVTKLVEGDIVELKWNLKNANGMLYRLKENGDTISVGKYNEAQPFVFIFKEKPIGKYHYEMRIEAPGHTWCNEVDVIVENKKST